jgi:hypothetical protein
MDTEKNLVEGNFNSNQQETAENKESDVDSDYEQWFTQHHPVNSGWEALIYQVPAEEAPLQLKNVLQLDRDHLPDSAIKVIKIFKPERASKEFHLQKKAYDIVSAELSINPNSKLAKVPKPLDYRDIHISEHAMDMLNHDGARLTEKKAGLLSMDFVQGKDLLHIFYQTMKSQIVDQKF